MKINTTNTKTRFLDAFNKGLENALDCKFFKSGVIELLEKATVSLNEIKVDESKEFKLYIEQDERFDSTYTFRIKMSYGAEKYLLLNVYNHSGICFKITNGRITEELDTPSLDLFQDIFIKYLSSSTFGELIYNKVEYNNG